MLLIWMPAHTTLPPGASAPQRLGDQFPDRREDDRGVEVRNRRVADRAGPLGSLLDGETLRFGVPLAG